MNQFTLHLGNCLTTLRGMADNSVDAVVTDPPYGLSFMGKKWDYDVPGVDVWTECLRVLKPGGHLLAFAGTRTQHRMAVRIEDAGFEIRDMIAWVYGSGFPKSLDVSKAIDKHGPSGQVPFSEFAAHYEARRKASGLTHAQVCAAGGWHGATNHGGTSANWENGYGMPTVEQWVVLQPLLGLGDEWAVRVEREQYEREVIGKRAVNRGVAFSSDGPDEIPITAPGSDAARQWQGWGTALKPALEPITVARKPFASTVAANVLQHGTGALNIDGCRVNPGDHVPGGGNGVAHKGGIMGVQVDGGRERVESHTMGRWPANLLHDGSDEVLAAFPDAKGQQGPNGIRSQGVVYGKITNDGVVKHPRIEAETSAARFFYCAKASRSDRNEGLDGFDVKRTGGMQATADGSMLTGSGNERTTARANVHPTVKPTDLMAYLVRLVTPPGGIVLDPFMGSGSTGKAAMREGMRFIGCEMDPAYLAIARARIEHELALVTAAKAPAPQPDLFALP
jgi:DNA modification methylase